MFRFKWNSCVSFATCQISQSWRYSWRFDEKSKCKLLKLLLLLTVLNKYLFIGSRTQIGGSQTNECCQNTKLPILTKRYTANLTNGLSFVAELYILFMPLSRIL